MEHFVKLHGNSVESYFQSDCFRPEMQAIDRKRKISTRAKDKNAFAKKAAAAGKVKSVTKRIHKKKLGDVSAGISDAPCPCYYFCSTCTCI